jgi:hypothetical protein
MIKFRVTYVPHIIRNDSEPMPMTDKEFELHQRWMRATGDERISLWDQLEAERAN